MGGTTGRAADLNGILVFVKVVQAGSFSGAGRFLSMPKSTVSRKISELEDRVGARLLHRTTRKLSLTDAGRLYHDHGVRVLAELDEAGAAVARMQSAPRGLLRVTAPLSFGMLAPILSEYLRKNPDVRVELFCTDRAVDLVEERFDVAIRAGQLTDSSLIARHLGDLERVLVAAPRYCKQHGTPRTPAELQKHACIAFGAGAQPDVWPLWAKDKKVNVRVAPRLTVNDFAMMSDAARAGLGIASMPRFVCKADLRKGRLVRVLPAWSATSTKVQALYPTARHLSPKVVAFIELVRARFKLVT